MNQNETIDLYVKRKKIQPREISGFFTNIRLATIWLTLAWFFSAPWILWGNRQALLFDLPNRKFYIFGATFWPQDLIYLAVLLIIGAVGLFFFTALAGRIWCGYTCPQTVWTKLFFWLERVTEGNRNQRLSLDKSSWTLEKCLRRGLKHLLWMLLSILTAFTFVGYFTPIRDLSFGILTLQLSSWELFWICFFSLCTYFNAGWVREQLCLYVCPYARFQSVMFDSDTLIISYDYKRGERRGRRKKGSDYQAAGLGDCVDCKQCVYVCPTGIDIRDGLQMGCIGCAACIDACNSIMDKLNYPRNLIRYTTENKLEKNTSKIVRARLIAYAAILTFLLVGLSTALFLRVPFDFDIIRDRNQLYRETPDGYIENVYTLKLMNKSQQTQKYSIEIKGNKSMKLVGDATHLVRPGKIVVHPLRIQVDPKFLFAKRTTIQFAMITEHNKDQQVNKESTFISPIYNGQ